jgi:hypothetical protein
LPKEEKESSEDTDSEIENEMLKCRDKYMADIYEKIDIYKIETMKKLSQQRFEDVEARPDDKKTLARKAEKYFQKNRHPMDLKISKMHQRFLYLEKLVTKNNIVFLFIGACFFTVFLLPYLMYSGQVIDRHYFGWFHELKPMFAKTTVEKEYYGDNGIPFMTIHDIYAERDHYHRRLAKGYPSYFEEYRQDKYK